MGSGRPGGGYHHPWWRTRPGQGAEGRAGRVCKDETHKLDKALDEGVHVVLEISLLSVGRVTPVCYLCESLKLEDLPLFGLNSVQFLM